MSEINRKPTGYWTQRRVDDAFDIARTELGKTPTAEEFRSMFPGALKVVVNNKYDSKIRTWNQYLIYRGEELNQKDWSPEEIDRVYDELKNKLGRTPKIKEFNKENSGALEAIQHGRYSDKIKSWNEYVFLRGDKINHQMNVWSPEGVDKFFDKLKERLGRVPRLNEMPSGAIQAIVNNRYNPNIQTWNGYLKHRGEKPNKRRIDRNSILENLLDEDNEDTQETS